MHEVLQPPGWAKPVGYANGIAAAGRLVFVGGQIGWNAQCRFESDDFVAQTRQALVTVVAVVSAAGGKPEHIASMTWFVTDRREYHADLKRMGSAYREVIGRHFPAMAVVEVTALMESRAKVEIQAIAVLPH